MFKAGSESDVRLAVSSHHQPSSTLYNSTMTHLHPVQALVDCNVAVLADCRADQQFKEISFYLFELAAPLSTSNTVVSTVKVHSLVLLVEQEIWKFSIARSMYISICAHTAMSPKHAGHR